MVVWYFEDGGVVLWRGFYGTELKKPKIYCFIQSDRFFLQMSSFQNFYTTKLFFTVIHPAERGKAQRLFGGDLKPAILAAPTLRNTLGILLLII